MGCSQRVTFDLHGQHTPDHGGVYLAILKTDGDVSKPFRSIVHSRNEENWLIQSNKPPFWNVSPTNYGSLLISHIAFGRSNMDGLHHYGSPILVVIVGSPHCQTERLFTSLFVTIYATHQLPNQYWSPESCCYGTWSLLPIIENYG